MTKTIQPRTGTSQWSSDGDAWPARAGWDLELAALEANTAVYAQGLTSARPVAGKIGRFYWATETQRLWYDNGTTWTEPSPVGGGNIPPTVTIGSAGAEGTSRIGARSDHSHPLPDPSTDPGALTYGGTGARGSSSTVARSDHSHTLPGIPYAGLSAAPLAVGGSGAVGVATTVSRGDHGHALPAPDVDPGLSNFGQVASRGSSSTPARADHAHPVQALPIATAAVPPSAIDIGDASAVGVSTLLARSDHQHPFPAPPGPPPGVGYGQTGTVGSAATAARSDHSHTLAALPIATQPPGDTVFGQPGAVGTSSNVARQDHSHLAPSMLLPTGGAAIAGTPPSNMGLVRLYIWHGAATTDSFGEYGVPLPFANAFITASITNSAATVFGSPQHMSVYIPSCTVSQLVFLLFNAAGQALVNTSFNVLVQAWGW